MKTTEENKIVSITNDGGGIYINHKLVDYKEALPYYWQGYDYWVNKVKDPNFNYEKRHEFICKQLKERGR